MTEVIDPKVASPVWWAIALHLGTRPDEVLGEQELRRDLGLDGLDLALIMMRVGDWLRVDVPHAIVDEAVTVGDLARAVVKLMAELDEDGRPSVLPTRTCSRTQRVAGETRVDRVAQRR